MRIWYQNSTLPQHSSTYIHIQPPMKPRINPQAILQPTIRTQRLTQHRTQKYRQRIIVPQPRHIDRNLQPLIPALSLARRIDVLAHVDILALALEQPRLPALLDFCFDAHDGLGAVGETHTRAAVCGGQDVGFGDERAELCWRTAVGADGRRGGEGGLQVGELGGREGDVGVGRHGLFGVAGFYAPACVKWRLRRWVGQLQRIAMDLPCFRWVNGWVCRGMNCFQLIAGEVA
jgi:hypothetical protein